MSLAREAFMRLERASGFHLRREPAHHRTRLLRHQGVDLVLDVGAATGSYALELRKHGYTGPIVSFEPLAAPYASLARAAAADPSWQAFPLALGAQPGEATINVAANSDSSSLLPMLDRHRQAATHAQYVGTEQITVSTLDAEWHRLPAASRPFLKIDTQGFEAQVLDGASTVLPHVVGVQLEVSFVPLYEGGMLYDQAFARMQTAGFVPMGVDVAFKDPESSQLLQADVVFFRP